MNKASTEELVAVQSEDGMRLDGAVIRPALGTPKPITVLHVPGGDMPFCHPLYLRLGRTLAGHGYVSVIGSNRGSFFGQFKLRGDELVITGLGWERFHECVLDIGPWVSFAADLESWAIALLGHSLGGAKVIYYQAHRQDLRVRALALASPGPLRLSPIDPTVVAEAKRLVAQGRGNDLLPWGSLGMWPRTLSAQALLEWAPGNSDRDVFGVMGVEAEPPLARVHCPLLVWYGGQQDIGGADDLELIRRTARAAPRVDTQVFRSVDHSYTGHEQEVGSALATWLDSLL